jgi:hypothetical protein
LITDYHFIMGAQHREATKIQLALALAQGVSVRAWARDQNVPKSTAYYWSKDPKVRRVIETYRRRALDRAIGTMVNRMPRAASEIAALADGAESESVRLRALAAIFSDVMAASKYSVLESRMANLEERLRERRAGNAGRQD